MCENLIGLDKFSKNSKEIEYLNNIFTNPKLCQAASYHVIPFGKELLQVFLASHCALETDLTFDGKKSKTDALSVECRADKYSDIKINWNLRNLTLLSKTPMNNLNTGDFGRWYIDNKFLDNVQFIGTNDSTLQIYSSTIKNSEFLNLYKLSIEADMRDVEIENTTWVNFSLVKHSVHNVRLTNIEKYLYLYQYKNRQYA